LRVLKVGKVTSVVLSFISFEFLYSFELNSDLSFGEEQSGVDLSVEDTSNSDSCPGTSNICPGIRDRYSLSNGKSTRLGFGTVNKDETGKKDGILFSFFLSVFLISV
jgi:hypothetical protein